MKKVIGMALVLMLAFSVAGAWAEEVAGKIKMFDSTQRMIVLDDGTQLWVAEGLAIDTLKDGASVKASYEERDGKKVVTELEVSE